MHVLQSSPALRCGSAGGRRTENIASAHTYPPSQRRKAERRVTYPHCVVSVSVAWESVSCCLIIQLLEQPIEIAQKWNRAEAAVQISFINLQIAADFDI